MIFFEFDCGLLFSFDGSWKIVYTFDVKLSNDVERDCGRSARFEVIDEEENLAAHAFLVSMPSFHIFIFRTLTSLIIESEPIRTISLIKLECFFFLSW